MNMPESVRRRVIEPIRNLLGLGVSPQRIAASVATGVLIGIVPLLGISTVGATIASLGFRLNLIVVQAFNWLVAGPQLLLILPYIRLGERIYGVEQPLELSRAELEALFTEGWLHAVRALGLPLLHAMTAWALTAPLLFILCYAASLPLILRSRARIKSTQSGVNN
jgi:uncharacterized protein (DUF2062 family)